MISSRTGAQAIDTLEDVPQGTSAVNNDQKQPISDIWKYGLFLASQGHKIFPLKKQSKKPLFYGWQDGATSDADLILHWAHIYPDYNYGIVTGESIFVIDLDKVGPSQIDAKIDELQAELGVFEIGTLVKTGGGYQLYCDPSGFDIKNTSKRLGDCVDTKGAGGYVVGPGSIHPNGQRYEFVDLCSLEDGIKLTKLSPAALQYIVSLQGGQRVIGADDETCVGKASNQKSKVPGNALDYVKPIPVGTRNDTLFKIACHYREVNRLQANDIYRMLRDINQTDCEKPLDDSEALRKGGG